jgi:hypothetical protein
MSQSRPFAYNPPPNPSISGTTQVGDIAVGVNSALDYFGGAGGVQWWEGPDEDLGYIVAKPIGSLNQPNPLGLPAGIGFNRSAFTDEAFIQMAELFSSGTTFANAADASIWLTNNGYWNSYSSSGAPSNDLFYITIPNGNLISEIIVNLTPGPGTTPTPTPSITQTPTMTVTPTNTSTPTPTPTQGGSGNFNVSISQQGPDVVWSGSGIFNLTDLTLQTTSTLGAGYAANQAIWAAGPSATVSVDQWSGPSFTTYPTSFGTGGSGAIGASGGSLFGILPGGSGRVVVVPAGYTSGTFISGSTTYTNSTISGMGLTPGTYTWSWGTGGNVSTMIMTITS